MKERYVNNPVCPCIFVKKSKITFAIAAAYIDDLYVIGTPKELSKTFLFEKWVWNKRSWKKNFFCLAYKLSICQVEYPYISQHKLKKFWSVFIWMNPIR